MYQAGHLCSSYILMPFWYQSQALLGAVTPSTSTKRGKAAFPINSVFLCHFIMSHTLLLFPQAMGLWTSEICKFNSATNTEFSCFWDYLFMYLKMSVCEKFPIKCPDCKTFNHRVIIACLGWILHNPLLSCIKKQEGELDKWNWTNFFAPKKWEKLYQNDFFSVKFCIFVMYKNMKKCQLPFLSSPRYLMQFSLWTIGVPELNLWQLRGCLSTKCQVWNSFFSCLQWVEKEEKWFSHSSLGLRTNPQLHCRLSVCTGRGKLLGT